VTDVIVNETSLLLSAEGGNEYGKVVADILSGDHGASVEVEAGSSYGKIDGTAQTANGSLDYSGGAGLDSEGLGKLIKKLSLCLKFFFSNPYIYST